MNFEKLIVIIIIFVLIIGGSLPRLYINFKFIQNFIASMKELIHNLRKEQALDNYEEIVQRSKEERRYTLNLLVNSIRTHKTQLLLAGLLLAIGAIFLKQWFSLMPEVENTQMAENLLLPIDLIALFGYWLCKGEKRKWQYSLLLIVVDILQISWKLFIMHSPFIIMDSMMLIVWIVIFIGYYYRWQMSKDISFYDLQQKLQASTVVNEELTKQYQALLEQRHDNKKHFNMLYHLNEEKEIAAMQEYLAQLERERAQSNEADR